MIKRMLNSKTLMWFIFLSLLISAIFVAYEIKAAPTVATDEATRVKGDYVLMLLQCILGMVAMLLPGVLQRRLRLHIPSKMVVVYALFLYCAIYLGEVRSFYYRIPNWDTILHTFSGAMLGALGLSFINILNKTHTVPLELSPFFIAFFAFCFAVSMGVVWEIYEFTADMLLGTNMQKFALQGGQELQGQAALMDTMKDLIVDTLGALIMSVIGYISQKYDRGWLEKVQLKFNA